MPSDAFFGSQNPSLRKECRKSREAVISDKTGNPSNPILPIHLTFFFLNSNQVCMISHHLTKLLFGQIRFQQQKIATWQGPEKMCYGITWLVESYRKSVVFLAFFLAAEAQIIFLTGMWPGFNSSLFWHMEKVHAGDILTICNVFCSVWLTPDFVHIFAHSWGMAMYCFRHQT